MYVEYGIIKPSIIQEKVEKAINNLFESDDIYLLKIDANERSISHKLAIYIQQEFEEFKNLSIDCEYNRNMFNNPKRIDEWKSRCINNLEGDDEHAKTVLSGHNNS